jgi:hypothetical protein
MAKPGPKPKRAANPIWTPELAYVCGLMASDGCLYSDGRHMSLTSQDLDQLATFKRCLGLKNKVSWKPRGDGALGSHVQFGDVTLYRWLISIGITPRKTYTIGKVLVPDVYFFDYLRGEFDGDGCSHAYWDSRWRSSVCIYIKFTCASISHLEWLKQTINRLSGAVGLVRPGSSAYQLILPKRSSRLLYDAMYYSPTVPYLRRKKEKLDRQWAANDLAKQQKQPSDFTKGGPVLRIA